jgi:hypothetical protein
MSAFKKAARVVVCSVSDGDLDLVLWSSSGRSSFLNDLMMFFLIFKRRLLVVEGEVRFNLNRSVA